MESNSHVSLDERSTEKPKLDRQMTIMESLPRETVLCILSKLPLSSLIRFKCVCRAWKELARDEYLADLYNFRSVDNNQCLVFDSRFCPAKDQISFVDFNSTCTSEECSVNKIHMPFGSSALKLDVFGSCNGLLCLSGPEHNDQYIYNPFTGQCIEIPKTNLLSIQWAVSGFGFHPKTSEYKVVKIVYHRPPEFLRGIMVPVFMGKSEVQVFTLGSSSWRSLGRASHILKNSIETQVLVNGRLHWLTGLNKYRHVSDIISFDLEDERFRKVAIPGSMSLRWSSYVVELTGRLCAVLYTRSDKELEIWVMKEYDVESSWVKGFNIAIRSHLPKALSEKAEESYKVSYRRRHRHRVLCVLKNGEILLEYESRALVVYDSKSGSFKDIVFQGTPMFFHTVLHLGNLNQIDAIV